MASEDADFDPYLKWLGIHPKDQPPNHYRLLGVELFEPDPDVINNAADARMLLVKTIQTGSNSHLSQKILNEVTAATVCLLDPRQKEKYDGALRCHLSAAAVGPVTGPKVGKWVLWGAVGGFLSALLIATSFWLFGNRPVDISQLPQLSQNALEGAPLETAPVNATKPPTSDEAQARSSQVAGTDQLPPDSTEVTPGDSLGPAMSTGELKSSTLRALSGGAAPGRGVAQPGPPNQAALPVEADSETPTGGTTTGTPAGAVPKSSDAAAAPESAAAMPSNPQTRPGAAPAAVVKPAAAKWPVPTRPEQQRAEKEIRESFRSELARPRTRQHKLALAEEMFRQGQEKQDDPASQYVLFQMACDLASRVGEVSRTMRFADEIASRFEVDSMELKADILTSALEPTRNAPALSIANLDLVENGLLLADEALAGGDVDVAERILKLAGAAARRSKSSELIQEVTARTKTAKAVEDEKEKVDKALAALQASPSDAEANLTAGRWYCFVKQQWEQGLPYLARGSDPALAAAAQEDLAGPVSPDQQLAVGDAWWQVARVKQGYLKARIARRAEQWLDRALPSLSPDTGSGVQQRFEEISQAANPLPPSQIGAFKAGNVASAGNNTVVTGANGPAIVDGVIPPTVGDPGIATDGWPCQWTITLDQVYRLREIRMKLPEGSYQNYVISTSPDGEHFVPLADRRKGAWFGWQQILFLSRPVKAIRIHGLYHSLNSTFYVTELEAYCAPPNSAPD